MNKPMIENSERGITLNKTLAWSMLVALVTLVWFGGTTVSSLKNATDNLASTMIDIKDGNLLARREAAALEVRVRVLENNASRVGAEFTALQAALEDVKTAQRETNALLRELTRKGTLE